MKHIKLIGGPIYFNGSISDLPHYNKNQIITCECENCKLQFNIKYSNLKNKARLLCKSCAVKLNTPYNKNGEKISKALKQKYSQMTNEEHYNHFVKPQLDRTEESKKETLKKYQNTIKNKSKEEIDAMRQKMHKAKALMTDEQKQIREQKFLDSFYKSQGEKIRRHAEMLLNNKKFSFKEKENFLYECECNKCNTKWIWSPIKKSEYHIGEPYCPKCFKDNRSKYEDVICDILKEMNITYITNDRSVLNGKEIDIWIPSENIAIEFDGVYWHQNSTKSLEKYKMLKKLNITLINIFENEFNYNKIKSVLQSKFKKSKIVYARKCTIKEINNQLYEDFCNENHIQNHTPAKIKIGLFYNDELIQIMSFSKPRFNKKYEWEIIRECSKNGIGVVGGKERLFKFFIKSYNPKSIISYCDKRWFSGESYLKLGMRQLEDSKPSYIYTNFKKSFSRFQCQKHKLKNWLPNFDENLTEYENMINNGYFKMYDFGQHIFEWRRI